MSTMINDRSPGSEPTICELLESWQKTLCESSRSKGRAR